MACRILRSTDGGWRRIGWRVRRFVSFMPAFINLTDNVHKLNYLHLDYNMNLKSVKYATPDSVSFGPALGPSG